MNWLSVTLCLKRDETETVRWQRTRQMVNNLVDHQQKKLLGFVIVCLK